MNTKKKYWNTIQNKGAKKVFMVDIKETGKINAILNHLIEYGSITSLEANERYGATRLASTICRLRKRGYKIETVNVPFVDRFGCKSTYGKYILVQ